MIGRKLITQAEVDALRQRCKDVMKDVAGRLTEAADGGKRRVRADLWPSPDFRDVGLRSDGSELAGLRYQEASEHAGERVERKFVDAVADVLDRRMETDPGVVVLGEDVHRLKGGTNGATRGLKDKYPDRVLGTPISENAFAGLGGGHGRPLPSDRRVHVPRLHVGRGRPGLQPDRQGPPHVRRRHRRALRAAHQGRDGHGLWLAALDGPGRHLRHRARLAHRGPVHALRLRRPDEHRAGVQDPVLVIEHVDLYGSSGEVPAGDLDYAIPFGKAQVRRQGGKVTILTYLSMVSRALKAAEAAGVDAEIIDLRTLDRASLDWDTIGESIKKTNNVLIVEQGARGTSYGAMLADEIQRRWFDWLDQPVKRVTGGEASPSISKVLERAAFADTEEVMAGLADVLADLGEQA